jgi:hypothetical protein
LEIRVPDIETIIRDDALNIENKINMLYGGQDIPQGNPKMDASRKRFPQFFCHKYGWTHKSIMEALANIGYLDIKVRTEGHNIVAMASKG